MKYLSCCLILLVAFTSTAKTLVDPTRPSANSSIGKAKQSAGETVFVLNAVFINGDSKLAVINGKHYQQGQNVLGNKLILISRNKVVLDSQHGRKTLLMNTHTIKKDINNGF
jgi:hypothetical protein